MINGKSLLAIIPARGGSKGLPGKNIMPLHGKPLIAWTIEAAQASAYIDEIVVSTDCKEIAQVATDYGCPPPFLRPAELATDEATAFDVVKHALSFFNDAYDYILLLQPTSPLRTASDIDNIVQLLQDAAASACVSMTEARDHPYLLYSLDSQNRAKPLIDFENKPSRRQEYPSFYSLNGALYLAESKWFLRNKRFHDETSAIYIMPPERSVDIDSQLDFLLAELLLKETAKAQ